MAQAGTTASPDPGRVDRLSGAIYGQVIVTATLAAIASQESLGPAAVPASTLAALLALLIAHVYSALLAERIGRTRKLETHEILSAVGEEWPFVQAAGPATLVLLLASVGVWSTHTAITLSLGSGVLSLSLPGD